MVLREVALLGGGGVWATHGDNGGEWKIVGWKRLGFTVIDA